MKNHKILILLTYYERPELVKGILRNLIKADSMYYNWELAFIDDGSQQKGRPIAERILGKLNSKVTFYDSEMSSEMKKLCGGCYIGWYMNQAIKKSDADIVIMVGDDDEICPDYLLNLDRFFSDNPECLSCYSNVYVFDPMNEKPHDNCRLYSDDPKWKGHEWFGKPINCAYKVDGIQVAWRTKCCTVYGSWFTYPITINHDALFFEELNARCEESLYTGFVGMWKGRHEGQLVKRNNMAKGVKDKKKGIIML